MSSFIDFLNDTPTVIFFGIVMCLLCVVYCLSQLFVIVLVNCIEDCVEDYAPHNPPTFEEVEP